MNAAEEIVRKKKEEGRCNSERGRRDPGAGSKKGDLSRLERKKKQEREGPWRIAEQIK